MDFMIRPFEPNDRAGVLEMIQRLALGVAPWRYGPRVLSAVANWLRSSTADDFGGFVWVATVDEVALAFYRNLGYEAEAIKLTKVLR